MLQTEREKIQRNKSEMFQYLRKVHPHILDKIFAELGEKTLSAIRLPTYFFQRPAKKPVVREFQRSFHQL